MNGKKKWTICDQLIFYKIQWMGGWMGGWIEVKVDLGTQEINENK